MSRFIAYTSLLISSVNFVSIFVVSIYMTTPSFENLVSEQVMKNIDWIVANELEKQIKKLKPRPVVDVNDPNKWFWDYLERRNKEYAEWETKGKWEQ